MHSPAAPPLRSASSGGAYVYTHSGEFAPTVFDAVTRARGPSFHLSRTYRSSLAGQHGLLGRGWVLNLERRLVKSSDGIDLMDAKGRRLHFSFDRGKRFASPHGFYGLLEEHRDGFVAEMRLGRRHVFAPTGEGGALLRMEDAHDNALRFDRDDRAIRITDTFGRVFLLTVKDGVLTEASLGGDKKWLYAYDKEMRLVRVTRPDGASTAYSYNGHHRLVSVTDPRGVTFLANSYDDVGRIVAQKHGSGEYRFAYSSDEKAGSNKTLLTRKNGSRVLLEHAAEGWVVRRELMPDKGDADRSDLLSGTHSLVSTASYNVHGEAVRETYPAGNEIHRTFDEHNADPRARGNLLQTVNVPGKGSAAPVSVTYEYDAKTFLRTASIDPLGQRTTFAHDGKGSTTRIVYPRTGISDTLARITQHHPVETFEYNDYGQCRARTRPDGSRIEYVYYGEVDPFGLRSSDVEVLAEGEGGGLLALVVRDAKDVKRTTRLRYDDAGRIISRLGPDGRKVEAQYDMRDRLVAITTANGQALLGYDANDNLTTVSTDFTRFEIDPSGNLVEVTGAIERRREFNALNKIVAQSVTAAGAELTTRFERDQAEHITRVVYPRGNATAYRLDARGLVIEKRHGDGSPDIRFERLTRAADGLVTRVAGEGGLAVDYYYDGLRRYAGFGTPGGTRERLERDAAGRVVSAELAGPISGAANAPARRLSRREFAYDSLGRLVSVSVDVFDTRDGTPLGRSSLTGEAGRSIYRAGYDLNGKLASLTGEHGATLGFSYDAIGRPTKVEYDGGFSLTMAYAAGGFSAVERAPSGTTLSAVQVAGDSAGRPSSLSAGGRTLLSVRRNESGEIIETTDAFGQVVNMLHDAFGRPSGYALEVSPPARFAGDLTSPHRVSTHTVWDANDNLEMVRDAAGRETRYVRNALDHVTAILHPDGTRTRFAYEANWNVSSSVRPNGASVEFTYDANGLLTRRISSFADHAAQETFRYDGAGRLIEASSPAGIATYAYDSTGLLIEDGWNGLSSRYAYDSSGALISQIYPSGYALSFTYDDERRLSSITDSEGRMLLAQEFDDRSRPVTANHVSGVSSSIAYDSVSGLVQSLSYDGGGAANSVSLEYVHDAAGLLIGKTSHRNGNETRQDRFHDSAGRMCALIREDGGVLYDLADDGHWKLRKTLDASGAVIAEEDGEVDARGNYSRLGDRRFLHDASGNRLAEVHADDHRRSFGYDAFDRLVRIGTPATGAERVKTFEYDHLGRARRVTDGNVTVDRLWSGGQLIEERSNGALIRRYLYGPGGEPILMSAIDGETERTYTFAIESSGAVVAVFDESAELIRTYDNDPFGGSIVAFDTPAGQDMNGPLVYADGTTELPEGISISGGVAYDPAIADDVIEQTYHGEPLDEWNKAEMDRRKQSFEPILNQSHREPQVYTTGETIIVLVFLYIFTAVVTGGAARSLAWRLFGKNGLKSWGAEKGFGAILGWLVGKTGLPVFSAGKLFGTWMGIRGGFGAGGSGANSPRGGPSSTGSGTPSGGGYGGAGAGGATDNGRDHAPGNSIGGGGTAGSGGNGGGGGKSQGGGTAPSPKPPQPKSDIWISGKSKSGRDIGKDANGNLVYADTGKPVPRDDVEPDTGGSGSSDDSGGGTGDDDTPPPDDPPPDDGSRGNPEGGSDEGPSVPWGRIDVSKDSFWAMISALYGPKDDEHDGAPELPWSKLTPQQWAEISLIFGPIHDELDDQPPTQPHEDWTNRDAFTIAGSGWGDWYSGDTASFAFQKFIAPRISSARMVSRF